MRFDCPLCGVRDESEFTWAGPPLFRPKPTCTDAEWTEYLWFRENPRGAHAERWCHTYGCGSWLEVTRDTVSHRVIAVKPA